MKKTVCFLIASILVLSAVLLSVSITASAQPGDVNDDGEVDNKDVVILFRFVSTNEEPQAECDINGDGKVSNKDVTILFRQISGYYEGETGEIPLPQQTRLLNKVLYDEKGKNVYFDDPEFISKLSSFSNKMFTMSAADEDGNYAVSPLSAYMALAILNAVGDNGIHSDIETLFGMDQTDIEKTKQLFLSLVKEHSYEDQLISKLDLTNTVWIDCGREPDQDTLDMIADKLFCYAHSTPFYANINEANKAIREFIADKTKGFIDTDFDLDPDTAFAIINTLYLKDVWGETDLQTENRTFYKNGEETEKEFIVTEYAPGEIAETDTAYYFSTRTENGYILKLILPKEGYTLKQAMTTLSLDEINACRSYIVDHGDDIIRFTRCIFPKFRIDSDTDLKEIFEDNGYLVNAFTGYSSSLLPDSELVVSDIIHKAVVNVDEKGVEGAAVTIIESKDTAIMLPDEKYLKDFVLDREFGFMITTYNDVILFEGTVVEP